MAIWYRVGSRQTTEIVPVDIEQASDHYVKVKGCKRKEGRITNWYSYFPKWEMARDELLARAERALNSARLELQNAQGFYGNVKGLKEPTPESERGNAT